MTFSDLGANQYNSIRVIIPEPPLKPVCIVVDRVCAACRKFVMQKYYWNYHDQPDPPTPYPPEKILRFTIDTPVITKEDIYAAAGGDGFYICVLYSFNITVIYLDQQMNRGKLILSHQGEEIAWLNSPAQSKLTAAIFGKVLSYALIDKIKLEYKVKLVFDFLSLEKVRLLVPTAGPCPVPQPCPEPDWPDNIIINYSGRS